MSRNINRLNTDLQMAQKEFGTDNIFWPSDVNWIKIDGFKLPRNFSHEFTNILILVPNNYGHGGCWRDVFINPELELLDRDGRTYRKLDRDIHGFREYPYASMSEEMRQILEDNQWFYLCLHDYNPRSSITNFLYKVGLFLANPYKDWESIKEYGR